MNQTPDFRGNPYLSLYVAEKPAPKLFGEMKTRAEKVGHFGGKQHRQ